MSYQQLLKYCYLNSIYFSTFLKDNSSDVLSIFSNPTDSFFTAMWVLSFQDPSLVLFWLSGSSTSWKRPCSQVSISSALDEGISKTKPSWSFVLRVPHHHTACVFSHCVWLFLRPSSVVSMCEPLTKSLWNWSFTLCLLHRNSFQSVFHHGLCLFS